VAERGREDEVLRVFGKWGLDAVVIGEVKDDGMLRVKDHGKVVAEISNRALADEAPLYNRPYTKPLRTAPLRGPDVHSTDLFADLKRLLASGDLCSKRWIWEQYDYQVRTNTVSGPGSEAAVVRIKGTPTSIAMALDGNGRYCSLDPREGTKLIVAECCRNLSVVGAEPIAATNNLNFGNPERPEIMAQLVESIEGMAEACRFFETPITGGNVSLYNETLGTPIHPTPVVGIVGIVPTGAPIGIEFKNEGRDVILLGGYGASDSEQFGSSQYAKVVAGCVWGTPPRLNMGYEKRVQTAIRELVRARAVESAHDVGEGGLAIALAECCFGEKEIGLEARMDSALSKEFLLFHEGPSRVIVSTADPEAVFKAARKNSVEAVRIGATLKSRMAVSNRTETLLDCAVRELKEVWENSLKHLLHTPVSVE
jgi:phosphoribosylformylglycinamidine synthase